MRTKTSSTAATVLRDESSAHGLRPRVHFFLLSPSGLEAFLPDGLHAVADIVKDMPPLDAAPRWQETADDTRDVPLDIKRLLVVDTHTLHTEAAPSPHGGGTFLFVPWGGILNWDIYATHMQYFGKHRDTETRRNNKKLCVSVPQC